MFQENCGVCSRMAGAEMRGTSIGAPDLKHWGFTTRASWFIPSHPHLHHGPKSTLQFSWGMLPTQIENRCNSRPKPRFHPKIRILSNRPSRLYYHSIDEP